jgi:hypothetical protein
MKVRLEASCASQVRPTKCPSSLSLEHTHTPLSERCVPGGQFNNVTFRTMTTVGSINVRISTSPLEELPEVFFENCTGPEV